MYTMRRNNNKKMMKSHLRKKKKKGGRTEEDGLLTNKIINKKYLLCTSCFTCEDRGQRSYEETTKRIRKSR